MQLAQSESQQSIASATSDMLESPSDPEGPSLVNSEVTSPTEETVPPVGSSPADDTTAGHNEASSPDGNWVIWYLTSCTCARWNLIQIMWQMHQV